MSPRASEASGLQFDLPRALEAHAPPHPRDDVKLLVARKADGAIEHRRFGDLVDVLEPGDLVVVNNSATLPAAVLALRPGVRVHFAPQTVEHFRVVELRTADGSAPLPGRAGERIELPGGASLELVAPYLAGRRLMLGRFRAGKPLESYLDAHGEPIRYGYVPARWPLECYQNVYATVPGSAEMPSAGRPFTRELLARLAARGVAVAQLTLHTGLSSPERHEPPVPEWYEVPIRTARMIATARRVIAVGTTVVRALETTGGQPGSGWTNLVIGPERGVEVVDGLITGWHEPEASHLQMLEAIAGSELLRRSYDEALARGYRWHEFGDSHLILSR